ncbi:MAG: hypothetical protein ABSF67_15470 [Roseiarcus sp.]|jgi:hypothetical protein
MPITQTPPTFRRPVNLSAFDSPDATLVVNADERAAGFAADFHDASDASPCK